jgi:hypothetical protein
VFDDLNFVAYDLVRAPKEEQRKLCEVWRRFLAWARGQAGSPGRE